MVKSPVDRVLMLPERSFFLFGPRGVGKSTWMGRSLSDAACFDLLESSLYLELAREPSRLESMIGKRKSRSWVVVDEIQKIPDLLDEVHRLMEVRGWRFALCGSSARKLRRRGTNLLGGRALTINLEGFVSRELGGRFDAESAVQWGTLPAVTLDHRHAPELLGAYVNTYIKEEIREEALVRSVPPFLRFLNIAGLINGQQVNGQNIAREAGVPRASVDAYFAILVDTLLGHFLPAYRAHAKVREQAHPKFYWFDPGVARAAAGYLFDPVDRIWKGFALETLLYHELRVYNETRRKNRGIYFYRTGAGAEIDFVIETRKRTTTTRPRVVCIEVKLADKWNRKWEHAMRSLKESGPVQVDRMIGVYTGRRTYHFGRADGGSTGRAGAADGLDVMPATEFLTQLWNGKIF